MKMEWCWTSRAMTRRDLWEKPAVVMVTAGWCVLYVTAWLVVRAYKGVRK